ncbi:acetyltransferase [Salmonella enterica subsp. enterica]|uniref:Acetyltransferase n=1 Tax=Salmonella enterica I TaxID=59201 RepID=A0A3S4ILM5_SALET|nr:acetyltransferase [Salmonella enterica subsp. enterica]
MWWAAAAWRRYPVANQTFVNCKKMYFLPVIRGQGLAKKLALMALDHAP